MGIQYLTALLHAVAVCCLNFAACLSVDNLTGIRCPEALLLASSEAAWLQKIWHLHGRCERLSENNYSFAVEEAAAWQNGSVQSTEFTDTVNGGILGSLLIDQCLTAPEALIILLGGKTEESGHYALSCQWLVACNLTVNWPRQRLKLNVSLEAHRSYTMKIVKVTNDSVMSEEPQVRFFYTRSNASENPLVQMTAGQCQKCSDTTGGSCELEVYLRAGGSGWTGRLQMRVMDHAEGDSDVRLNFTHSPSTRWIRQPLNMTITGPLLQTDIYRNGKLEIEWRRSFYRIDAFRATDGPVKSLWPQLCNSAAPVAARVPCWGQLTPVTSTEATLLLPAAAVVAAATFVLSALATSTILLCLRRRRCRPRLLLVFPEAATAAADRLRRCAAVAAFRRELLATDAVKRGRLSVREVAGLRRLTPALARDSRLIVFLSDDPAFSCFSLDGLSDEASLALKTVITERSRTRGLFVTSGSPPAAASDWALLAAQRLGENVGDVSKLVHSFTKQFTVAIDSHSLTVTNDRHANGSTELQLVAD